MTIGQGKQGAEASWGGAAAAGARAEVTVGTLLARTFTIWRERFAALAGITLAVQLASLLLAWGLGSPFLATAGSFGSVTPEAAAYVATGRYWLLVGISLCLGLLQLGALAAGTLAHDEGRRLSGLEMVGGALGRAGPLFGAAVLALLAVFLGTILLIVPGIIVAVTYSLVLPVVIAERRSPLQALGRSRALTKGRRWVLLGTFVLLYAAVAAPAAVVGGFTVGNAPARIVLGALINVVLGPLMAIAPAVAYRDLRRLKEGADTAQLERVFE